MADNCDAAQLLADHRLELALAAHARQSAAVPNYCNECDDCNEEIPAARRRALPHATRCVECQGAHELQAKGWRR